MVDFFKDFTNSDWVNTIITVVAVAGFIVSVIFSIFALRKTNRQLELSKNELKQAEILNKATLEQNQKLFRIQVDIQLFEKRYEVL